MRPEKDWTVIDVGAGAGTLALPLASRVRHVAALDFSAVMLDLLRAERERSGIKNVMPVFASWEDDWSLVGVCKHDFAVASRSMTVENPRAALEKLNAIAARRVFVSLPVGDGAFDRKLFEAIGRQLPTRPDYIFAYNIQHETGTCPSVTFIATKRNKTYVSQNAAYESLLWMFPDLNETEETELRNFVSQHVVRDRSELRFDYDRTVCWAVLVWDVAATT